MDIRAEFSLIEEHISELKAKTMKVEDLENALCTYQTSVVHQARKLTDLEDRSRRSNLIVYGITEDENESESDLKRKVIKETFEEKLDIKWSSIGRIHRLGKQAPNRPVIIFFQGFNEKASFLKKCHKLKGTDISIQNDSSPATLKRRKMLWQSAKPEKLQGKKVFLVHDKLHIDSDVFVWDETKHARRVISKPPQASPT